MQREYIEIKEGLVGKKTLFQSISFKGMMAKTKAEEQKLENASKKEKKKVFLIRRLRKGRPFNILQTKRTYGSCKGKRT